MIKIICLVIFIIFYILLIYSTFNEFKRANKIENKKDIIEMAAWHACYGKSSKQDNKRLADNIRTDALLNFIIYSILIILCVSSIISCIL